MQHSYKLPLSIMSIVKYATILSEELRVQAFLFYRKINILLIEVNRHHPLHRKYIQRENLVTSYGLKVDTRQSVKLDPLREGTSFS